MSCANTSLPWFIDPPRAMLPRGVAKPKFEIQIETKKINRLCVFHQQLTGAESPNVGTLLPEYECFHVCSNAWGSYINGSLRSLITTAKGRPNQKGKGDGE